MENLTTIDKVVEDFAACGFDDLGTSMPYMKELKTEWEAKYDVLTRDNKVIKEYLLEDLKLLHDKIEKHASKEFVVLPETFDFKNGHWNSLHFILSRWYWFMKAKKIVIPYWYILLSEENKKSAAEQPRQCKTLVANMISVLINPVIVAPH